MYRVCKDSHALKFNQLISTEFNWSNCKSFYKLRITKKFICSNLGIVLNLVFDMIGLRFWTHLMWALKTSDKGVQQHVNLRRKISAHIFQSDKSNALSNKVGIIVQINKWFIEHNGRCLIFWNLYIICFLLIHVRKKHSMASHTVCIIKEYLQKCVEFTPWTKLHSLHMHHATWYTNNYMK